MKIRLKTVKKNNNNDVRSNNKVSRNNDKDNINIIDNNIVNDDTNNSNSNSTITMLHYEPENNINQSGIILKIILFTIVDFIAQISKVVFYILS